mgnify:FL=1
MKKPNVVIIISDQLSTRIVDGSGHNKHNVSTRGIDSIAKEGVRFTESYSAFPLCGPARSSIFTGMMPHNHNITDNEEVFNDQLGFIPRDENIKTMGELFKKDGYETCYFGKEHAGGYGWKGIDNFGSMKFSAGGMLAEGSAFDQIFTKDAIDFINQEHKDPFYMTLSLINPHDICKVLGGKVQGATFMDAIFFCRDDSEPYLRFNERASLPTNYDIPYIKGMIDDEDYMYKELDDRDENEWRQYISTYNLLVEKIDWYIELVLEALKKNGLEEDTIVVFTTDHGDLMGSHKLIAKTNFYEESAKTFMLVKYPKKIEPAINSEAKISSIDLMPTLLDLCNISAPSEIDGKSFKEALYNDNKNFDILVSENPFGKMIRYQSLKYIRSIIHGVEYEILLDLDKDPEESTNFIEDSSYQKKVIFLREYLNNYLKEKGIALNYR